MDSGRLDIHSLTDALNLQLIEECSNGELRFRCPDSFGYHKHGDRSGKLYINGNKGVWHCWVCGGGKLPSLVARIKECSYSDAAAWLKQFGGLEYKSADLFSKEIESIFAHKAYQNETVLPYYNPELLGHLIYEHPFFRERQITCQEDFKCGWDSAKDAIVFSHFWKGKLVGWQTRFLGPRKSPKYVNTKSFPRQSTLWGYDYALKQNKLPILVESVPSALFLISNGYSAIATFGARITDQQIGLLKIFHEGVILAPNNDRAGELWLSQIQLKAKSPIYILPLVDGVGSDIGDIDRSLLDQFISEKRLLF
jgi:DNA primase